jgi:hypothetical protein
VSVVHIQDADGGVVPERQVVADCDCERPGHAVDELEGERQAADQENRRYSDGGAQNRPHRRRTRQDRRRVANVDQGAIRRECAHCTETLQGGKWSKWIFLKKT